MSKLMFLSIAMFGTILTVSSCNWLGMWMGLEINLIAFIPLIFKNKNNKSSESAMIYFLIQSMGSIIFLISLLWNSNFTPLYTKFLEVGMLLSMMMKLGGAPFHFWFPTMMEKTDWIGCLMLMSWQKVAPLAILSSMMEFNFINVIIIMNVMIGALGGLGQTSVKSIMAFSSINHLGWMIGCMKYNNELWMKYLGVYSIIVLTMTVMFDKLSVVNTTQITSSNMNFTEKCSIISLFLSMGGLPPFLGFLPKWMVIQSMIMSDSSGVVMIMIMMSLLTLMYYLRMMSAIFLISHSNLKWGYFTKTAEWFPSLALMLNLTLPILASTLI